MMKDLPRPNTASITSIPMEWDIPQSFYDFLDNLEQAGLQPIEASQSSSNQVTETSGCKVKYVITKHPNSNTNKIITFDKATNTDPPVILEPSDIQLLTNGFKLLSFNIPEVFLQTTNSCITPYTKPIKYVPKYVPTPISDKTERIKQPNYSRVNGQNQD